MLKRNRNPDNITDKEILDLYKTISDKDKSKARKAAQSLRKILSDNKFHYWTISKKYTNLRQPDIDVVIQRAISIPAKRNPSKKLSKSRNPVTVLNRTGEVTIKYNGNKIIFDGKDAKSVINLVKSEYTDNSELQNVLG